MTLWKHRKQIGVGLAVFASLAAGLWLRLEPSNASIDSYRNEPRIYISGAKEGYGSGGVISQLAAGPAEVSLSAYQVSGDVKIKIYRANRDTLFAYLLHDKDGKQLKQSPKIDTMEMLGQTVYTLKSHDYDSQTVSLPISGTGIFYVSFEVAGVTESAVIVRSNIAAIVKEGNNEFIFWGQDTRSGRSLTDGSIEIWNLLESPRMITEHQIDPDGIAHAPLVQTSDIALIKSAGDIALVPLNLKYLNVGYAYQPFQRQPATSRYFLFTDRPLYQPGDTINLKAILRSDDDGRYSVARGRAQIKLIRNYQTADPIIEKSVAISANGTVDAKLALSLDALPGNYQVEVSLPRSLGQQEWENTVYAYVSVEHYRKPEYSLDATVTQSEYIAGDHVPVTIKGAYFFGQPLANKKVTYTVKSSPYYDSTFYDTYRNELNDEYRYGYYAYQDISSGDIKLNERGEGVIDIIASLPAEEKLAPHVLSVEAMIDDGSGNPAFARKNILVFPSEINIFKTDYASVGITGEKSELALIAIKQNGSPVRGAKFEAIVTRNWWEQYYESTQKYPLYRTHRDQVTTIKGSSNAEGKVTLSFTPNLPGSYEMSVSTEDSKGRSVEKKFSFWVTDQNVAWFDGGADNTLMLTADRAEYDPTGTAVLTVTSTIPDRDVLLTMERGRVNRYQIVHMQGKVARVPVGLVGTDIPNIFAHVDVFSSTSVHSAEANLKVSARSKKIAISIKPQQSVYAPGDTVRVAIATTDSSGAPIPAEVALWSIDKSILELADEARPDIFETFWSERYNDTMHATSLDGIVVQSAEGGGCFLGDTEILMADGTRKLIRDVKVGDRVRTRSGVSDAKLVSGKVTDVHQAQVSGYLIINGSLKVTPNHIIRTDGAWKDAGSLQVGDTLVDTHGALVPITSIEWQLGKTQVYNLTIESYHTFFANGFWVHNDKGGGGQTRSTFKDTAYWNPVIQTDASGHAQVTFTLPDNLTTWVLNAVGVASETRVGQSTVEIVATKEVITRLIVPNIMRIDDEMKLSAIVQNYSDASHEFDVSLDFDAGSAELEGPSTITIPSKGIAQLFWNIKPTKSDKTKAVMTVKVQARDNKDLGDSVSQAVPLLAFGYHDARSMTGLDAHRYEIALEKDAHPSETSLSLELAPTLLGTLPKAMEYLIQYPYGCVEQTTSRFVPAVIAKENPKLFKDALRSHDADAVIRQGIKRLAELQQPDGGWGWWTHLQSDPYITAYVMEYLTRAGNLKFATPAEVLANGRGFLDRAKTSNGSQDIGKLGNDQLASAVLENIKLGDRNPDSNGTSILIARAKKQGDGLFWDAGTSNLFGSIDASTALALRALIASGADDEILAKAVRFLTSRRERSYWSNTYATAQVIQALVDYSKKNRELTPALRYVVALDGKEIKSGSITDLADIVTIAIPADTLANGAGILTVEKSGQGKLYSTLSIDQVRTARDAKSVRHGLRVERAYRSERGDSRLQVGDIVEVRLTISGLAAGGTYGVIDDELPAGLVPINETFKNEQYGQDSSGAYTYDSERVVKENGMIISPYELTNGVYTYRARAVMAGAYAVPPAYAALMYSPEVYGRSAAQTVSIQPVGSYVSRASTGVSSQTVMYLIAIGALITVVLFGIWKRKRNA